MRWTKYLLLTLMLSGLCFCLGCLGTQGPSTPNGTAVPTPLSTTVVKTATATPVPVRAITTTPTSEPTVEEEPIPDWTEEPVIIPPPEKDITKINFTKYYNDDFFCEYPATWSIVNETFTLPSVELYDRDIWKKEGRMVSFVSEDETVLMKVIVYDFITPGKETYTPTIETARRSVQTLFPNASADTSVYEYQYKKNEQGVDYTQYDVLFYESSEYYPYSYTEMTFITFNHMFNVDFIVRSGNLLEYKYLRDHMLKSVKTEGKQMHRWW